MKMLVLDAYTVTTPAVSHITHVSVEYITVRRIHNNPVEYMQLLIS